MKARSDSNPDSIYNNDSLGNCITGNEEFDDADEINNGALNGYSSNGVCSRKSPSKSSYHAIIPSDHGVEKELKPLHFNTNEVLEETPAILKSLNPGSRGPDTFVYLSSPKPTSLSQTDDPCKTFVISSDKIEFFNKKNTLNHTLTVNGGQRNANENDNNEYLSYVIEKANGSEFEKMNKTKNNIEGSDEVDFSNGELSKLGTSEYDFRNDDKGAERNCSENSFRESEICDKNVQYKGEKTGEDIAVSFDRTIAGKKEQAFSKLQDELEKAHQELKLKDEEVARLTRIREDVERELEELTASLFQEAHKMVSKAKEKQAAAEKSLTESQMKVDVLTAEVVALKTLVLTSTPSRPNPHLHPQIGKEDSVGGVNLFNRKHRRSPSHFNLKYGRENSPPESPVRDEHNTVHNTVTNNIENRDLSEVDPTVHKEFLHWTLNCKLDKTDPFIDRIYREDINLCLDFSNRGLAEEVQKAIETRNIYIEAVTDKSKTIFPRKCALLEVTRQCHYRMKLGDEDIWHNISQMCRNRIIAVCDFINYLRYIELGLVKSSSHDMYWEIMRLRKEMVLARLGLSLPPS